MNLYQNETPEDFIIPLIFNKLRAIQTIAAFSGRAVVVAKLYRIHPSEIKMNRPAYLKHNNK